MRFPRLQPPLLWQAYFLIWLSGLGSHIWGLPGLFCFAIVLATIKRLHTYPRVLCSLCLLLFGHLLAMLIMARAEVATEAIIQDRQSPVCGTVVKTTGMPNERLRIFLDDIEIVKDGQLSTLPGQAVWTWEQETFRPLPGQKICARLKIQPVHGFHNPGLPDWSLAWQARGIFWRLWSKGGQGQPASVNNPTGLACLHESFRTKFIAALAPPGMGYSIPDTALDDEKIFPQSKAILLALIFGDRYLLSQSTIDKFSTATLSHTLALSGQHLIVAGFIAIIIVFCCSWAFPRIFLCRARIPLTIFLSCIPALFYLWLGGAPPSLKRAVAMLIVLALWLLTNRARMAYDILCIAALCLLCFKPMALVETGLQLSILAVGTICLVAPLFRKLLQNGNGNPASKTLAWFAAIFLTSLAVQTALLPVNLLLFGNVGFYFFLNIVWVPAVNFLVLPLSALGLVMAALDLASPAHMILNLAAMPNQWLLDFLAIMENLQMFQESVWLRPHWSSIIAFALMAGTLSFRSQRDLREKRHQGNYAACVCIGLLLLYFGPMQRIASMFSKTVRISALDVGQGQSLCLSLPSEKLQILMDGGGTRSRFFDTGKALVIPAMTYNQPPCLAAAINSHPDNDHLKGLLHVIDRMKPNQIFHNGRSAPEQNEKIKWAVIQKKGHRLSTGDRLILGKAEDRLHMEVLHPPISGDGSNAWKGNDASLVLRLVKDGQGLALFTGDVGNATLKHLLELGTDIKAKVLIAPHHGSDRSFHKKFMEKVNPEAIIVSCGNQNRYAFPGKALVSWAKENGVGLFQTGKDGQISIDLDDDKITVVKHTDSILKNVSGMWGKRQWFFLQP